MFDSIEDLDRVESLRITGPRIDFVFFHGQNEANKRGMLYLDSSYEPYKAIYPEDKAYLVGRVRAA